MLIVEVIIQLMDILLRIFDVVAQWHCITRNSSTFFSKCLFDIGVVMKQIASLETAVYLYEEELPTKNIISKQ